MTWRCNFAHKRCTRLNILSWGPKCYCLQDFINPPRARMTRGVRDTGVIVSTRRVKREVQMQFNQLIVRTALTRDALARSPKRKTTHSVAWFGVKVVKA